MGNENESAYDVFGNRLAKEYTRQLPDYSAIMHRASHNEVLYVKFISRLDMGIADRHFTYAGTNRYGIF